MIQLNFGLTVSVLLAMLLYAPVRWVVIRCFAILLVLTQSVFRRGFRWVLARIGKSRLWREAAVKADLFQEQAKQ